MLFFFSIFFSTAAVFGRCVSAFPLSWEHFMEGLLCLDPPPVNPPVSNCPTPQLSSPLQHNNSTAAPGASCHPELSFVLLLLSLLDWMLALCDCPVSSLSSPQIIFLKLNEKGHNDGQMPGTVYTYFSSDIQWKLSALGYLLYQWVSALIWCKFIHSMNISGVTSFPLDGNPFPSMWPRCSKDGSTVVCVYASCNPPPAHCGVFIRV